MSKKLLLVAVFVFAIVHAFAQERTITGKVTTADEGVPLPGVSVLIKGTTIGTVTNADGDYSISAPSSATLLFTFIGLKGQELPVGDRTQIDVRMEEDISQLEEVVISGLATNVKRSNLANAVATVSAAELVGTTSPVTTDGALQGKIAGANIQSNGSMPGGGFNMQLRGVSTLGSSASQPLFIVDGIYVDNSQNSNGRSQANKAVGGSSASAQDNNANRLADLNPDDIENIEILKGASAAAIYGTRANAGVVIITTKRGKGGKTKVSFGQDLGFSKALSFYGGADWTEEKLTDWFNPAQIPQLQAAKADGTYTDYEREIFGETGKIKNTRLSVTGGDDKTKFYINGSIADETGIVKNTGFKRYSFRINIDHKLSKWFEVGVSSNYINTNNDRGWAGNDNSYINYGYSIPYTKPYVNLFPDAQGNYPDNLGVGENPLAIRDKAVNNQRVNRFFQGLNATAWLLNNSNTSLSIKATGGLDYQSGYALIWLPTELQSQRAEANPGFAQDTRNEVTNYNMQLSAVLTNSVMGGKLDLTTSAGIVQLGTIARANYIRGRGLPAGVSNPGRAKVFESDVELRENTDQGFFFQEEANYEDKIIASVGIRLDRSTLNGDPNEWFAFPRAALATNIHNLTDALGSTLSQLKLRVAYGQTAGLPSFATLYSRMDVVGTGGQSGFVPQTTLGNPNIQPERATELEYGVDFGLLDNRITAELTLYNKKVFDLIQPLTTAPTTGVTSTLINAADLVNNGMELSLGADVVRTGNFSWFIQPIFWYNRSKITRLDIPERLTGGFGATFGQWRVKEGYSPTQIVGQPRTDPADPTSWTVYGDQQPKYEFSLNQKIKFLKNFEFDALLNYRHRFTVVSLARVLWDEGGNTSDWNSTSLGLGADGKPAATPEDVVPNGIARQNVNGLGSDGDPLPGYNPVITSFLKLREVALYYRIPQATLTSVFRNRISGIKVGVSGNNLLRWTDYTAGYDPENSNFGSAALGSGVELGSIPAIRRMMFHVAIDL
ncbi:MAG TPA: SusC/RagA family TonB-linked outer membrane protein [Chryseosolibacter sp.]